MPGYLTPKKTYRIIDRMMTCIYTVRRMVHALERVLTPPGDDQSQYGNGNGSGMVLVANGTTAGNQADQPLSNWTHQHDDRSTTVTLSTSYP
jgi:hypothetical protein